jgi:hypothetical protein
MAAVEKAFGDRVIVTPMVAHRLSIYEQARITSQAAIFVTGSGGGAVTASFLPRGASLIVYFTENGGMRNGKPDNSPARLDWDIFNNMGYLRVHWLPLRTMNKESDLAALVQLVDHELHMLGDG